MPLSNGEPIVSGDDVVWTAVNPPVDFNAVSGVDREKPSSSSSDGLQFYVGLHQPSDAKHFDRVFISVTRLRQRRGPFPVGKWILDSGAFSTISRHNGYPESVAAYADEVRRWRSVGHLQAVVAEDYMCEPWMLAKTGLTIADHQRLTIERYDELVWRLQGEGVYVLPVLQGYAPADYVAHLQQYGPRLYPSAWVGVGSVCKRNGRPEDVVAILTAIHAVRPDLRLHGFGLKLQALLHPSVRAHLASADSMAWSFAARREGRNQNSWREAERYQRKVFQILGS